ncbi:MAG: NFACT family protein [Deltaproteobacteria bacterium]|nr:NFACT family protein [Deltaproteobacteria bacterium]
MNPSLLKVIAAELNDELSGGVVSKIHQSDDRTLILRIFIRGRDLKLLVSARHSLPRLHLTDRSYPNPPSPLRFCAFLRSRITNARIEGVAQTGFERIAVIELAKKDGEDILKMRLVAELTGKSSNIILVDDNGIVLDALRFFGPESARPVVPGEKLGALPAAHGAREEEHIVKEEGESWNSAADRHYSALVEGEEFAREKAALKKVINESEKKLLRKLSNLEGDRKKAEEGLSFYKKGELLTTVFHKMKKGMKEVEATDYSKDPPEDVLVSLDVLLSPQENVERLFKRARKSKTAINLLDKRLPDVKAELEYVESLKYEWEAAEDKAALSDIREELVKGGYLKETETRAVKAQEKAEPIRRFVSSEGFEILCGRSGLGNDQLLSKYASGEDIWFHVKGSPGSHALIKVAGKKQALTVKTIEEAASIAAFYSKLKESGKAEVIYTEAKNVKKPKGAKPGMVTVKEYKSVVVRPGVPKGAGDDR